MTFDPYPEIDLSTCNLAAITTHYQWMCSYPGGKAAAWWQVNEMARNSPDLFKELPAMLTAAMLSKKPSLPTETRGQTPDSVTR